MTKYNIYVRYYNDSIGKCVTNTTDCKWYGCTETEYNERFLGHYITHSDMDQDKLKREKETLETLFISREETTTEEDINIYDELITEASTVMNPKYDMIFIWEGLGYYKDEEVEINQIYFDKMKRVYFRPWFFHSTSSSLKYSLEKVEELIDLFGKENVMLVKEVPLDQYVDIV